MLETFCAKIGITWSYFLISNRLFKVVGEVQNFRKVQKIVWTVIWLSFLVKSFFCLPLCSNSQTIRGLAVFMLSYQSLVFYIWSRYGIKDPKRLSVFRKYGQWNCNCSFNDRFEKIFFGQLYLKSRLTNRWFFHKHSCKTQSYIALEKLQCNFEFCNCACEKITGWSNGIWGIVVQRKFSRICLAKNCNYGFLLQKNEVFPPLNTPFS